MYFYVRNFEFAVIIVLGRRVLFDSNALRYFTYHLIYIPVLLSVSDNLG